RSSSDNLPLRGILHPMDKQKILAVRDQALALIEKSGFALNEADMEGLAVNDFGLGNLDEEGMVFVDLLRSPRARFTLLVMTPGQSLPEHVHPPHDGDAGKEETMRVIWGQAKVYVPGPPNNPAIRIPAGKDACYRVRHEVVLNQGDQYTIDPNLVHWFQAGPEGAVTLTVQNRVDETKNLFTDPMSTGCPIPLNQ
ncbi:MAG: hypothetical protein AAF961_13065, partial [Planctomycetota bacterium]